MCWRVQGRGGPFMPEGVLSGRRRPVRNRVGLVGRRNFSLSASVRPGPVAGVYFFLVEGQPPDR
jgi:hypothetical protein